jgi:hypothetical protein
VQSVSTMNYDCARDVISAIGTLALAFFKATKHRMCTVIATSLVGAVFCTLNNRPVIDPDLKGLTHEGVLAVVHAVFGTERAAATKQCALIMAVAGTHFRSVIMVARHVSEKKKESFAELYDSLRGRIVQRGYSDMYKGIQAHVILGCREGFPNQVCGDLEQYVDSHGVVPTVFIWAAFLVKSEPGADETTFREHPLRQFFETSVFIESHKQLEKCAAYFDIFRAKHELPVVPSNINVHFPGGWSEGGRAVYKDLKFPGNLKLDERAFFETRTTPTNTDGKHEPTTKIFFKSSTLELGSYYLPTCNIHPMGRPCLHCTPLERRQSERRAVLGVVSGQY